MNSINASPKLSPRSVLSEAQELLTSLGVPVEQYTGGTLAAFSPITGERLALVPVVTPSDAEALIARAHTAFLAWRTVPMPRRGELVRLLGEELRANLDPLGRLVTLEAGKILSEGRGEVQEMIDICTHAVGLSRTIGGVTVHSERPDHRMMEQWHPLGVVGIISAFNFPVAVWSWNAALALVCGDSMVWKPSEKTPLTALAVQALFLRAARKFAEAGGAVPADLSVLLVGDARVGEVLVDSPLVKLVSATGSTRMGRAVGPRVAARFGRSLLELGGNNAAIICPSANLELTLRGIAFSAMGTAGQRCTTLRRLIVHNSVYEALLPRLRQVYRNVAVGDPRDKGTLVGPLIDRNAFDGMQAALSQAREQGATVTGGERVEQPAATAAFYARPALVENVTQNDLVRHETFAPILYVLRYETLDEAIALHNDVPQGLSSSIFTANLMEAETFLSALGSDCGIANVNLGPSGAEIGGAFGGEKETGGGRESGSDSWKAYVRRATNTINFGATLPLAQGVVFEVD